MEPQEPIEALLRDVFGSQAKLAGVTIAKKDEDYRVLAVQLEHPHLEVMVKLAGPRAALPCPFERTAALLRRVAATTAVPVVSMIAADTSYRDWPWRYCVYERAPGLPWGELREQLRPEEQADARRQLGQAVAQLHSVRFEAFGELTDEAAPQAVAPYLAALEARAALRITAAPLRDTFLAALERYAGWFSDVTEARLTHEDLHEWNVLFAQRGNRWQLTGIVDFDKAWAGHAESDLARLEFWDGMTDAAFWESYTALQTVEPQFAQRRLIYQLFWCLEFARATPRHLADTRRVVAGLGLPPVEWERYFG
jgi:fructosamine-3-kinase